MFYPLLYSSHPSYSAFAAAAIISFAPAISMLYCYHHHTHTRPPCFLSVASQRFRSDRVAMYCDTVFYLCQMYASIVSIPTLALAASVEVYSHLPSACRCGSRPVNCRDT